MTGKWLWAWVPILCLVGLVITAGLTQTHHELRRTDGERGTWLCSGRVIACLTAAESRYAVLLGMPLSTYGFVFYLVIGLTGLVANCEPERRPGASLVLLGATALAVAVSAYLFLVSWLVLQAFCPFCVTLYLVNIGLFALALRLDWLIHARSLPRRWRSLVTVIADTPRLFLVGSLCGAIVLGLSLSYRQDVARYLHRTRLDLIILDRAAAKTVATASRPSLGRTDAAVTVVAFFDYACPHCATLERDLRDLVRRSAGDVRLVLRHFPLERCCNPRVGPFNHAGACRAAQVSEEIFAVGGNTAFWRFHDSLIGNRMPLSTRIDAAAARSGMPPAARLAFADSAARRVQEDIADADRLGVWGAPFLFINGHPVSGSIREWAIELVIQELRRQQRAAA